jgi:hypothetical protein
VIAGVAMWGLLHRGGFGATEKLLAVGAACAVAAATLQALSLPAVRRLRTAGEADALAQRRRIATTQRIAAGLLAVAIVCMAASRYA